MTRKTVIFIKLRPLTLCFNRLFDSRIPRELYQQIVTAEVYHPGIV